MLFYRVRYTNLVSYVVGEQRILVEKRRKKEYFSALFTLTGKSCTCDEIFALSAARNGQRQRGCFWMGGKKFVNARVVLCGA